MNSESVNHEPHRAEIAFLYEIGPAFYGLLEVEAVIQSILERLSQVIGAEGGSVWLASETSGRLVCEFAAGVGAERLVGLALEPGEGVAGWVAQNRTAVISDDVHNDPRWTMRNDEFDEGRYLGMHSLLSVPLIGRGETLGAISLVNKVGVAGFSLEDQDKLMALAGLAALAIHNARLFEKERRGREQQALLQRVSQLLHETLDLDRLLRRIFEQVSELLKAEATSVWLVDEKAGAVVCRVATGSVAERMQQLSVPLGQGIVGLVASTGEPLLIVDAQNDPRVFRKVDATTGFVTRSMLTVPLLRQNRRLGAIQVVNKQAADGAFTPFDQEVLERLADSAALAIENARLFGELEQSYAGTLDALAAALDLRDKETQGHSRRVVEYTTLLAQQIGVNEADLIHIRRGALLHDIGKIGVPDRVLHKAGPLDAEERAVIERHPWLGYEMAAGIPFLSQAAEIILGHQERFDGRGYPRALSGAAVPLGARLFAIADTHDAITSDRPYRKGKPYQDAAAEIARESGKQFDPQAVQAFLAIPPEKWTVIREHVNAEVDERRHELQTLAHTLIGVEVGYGGAAAAIGDGAA